VSYGRPRRRLAALSPDRARKVREIEAALAQSDGVVRAQLKSIQSFERYAQKHVVGRQNYLGSAIHTLELLRGELLRARDRLDGLHTGLVAESLLRSSLTESAAAVEAWRRGLDSNDVHAIDVAIVATKQHFRKAAVFGRAGARNLKSGR
jgi:hypothetical protein